MGDVELLDEHEQPVRFGPAKVLLGVVVLATFGIWAYAYSGMADRPAPDSLAGDAFPAAAEARCAVALADVNALEPAHLASDNVDRSQTIVEANAVLGSMVADLRGLVTGDERDRQIVGDWLDDWETYLGDRADYANRLAADPGARFYQSDVANEFLDRRITRLADTNRMPSCGVPGDVG